MGYVNYDKYLREFERSEYERELRISKQLLESYQEFKEIVVPVIKQCIKLSMNNNFKTTAQGVLLMCDIGEAKLKPICANTQKSTLKELRTINKNFSMSMELIQTKYKQIVTEELPRLEGGEGFGI